MHGGAVVREGRRRWGAIGLKSDSAAKMGVINRIKKASRRDGTEDESGERFTTKSKPLCYKFSRHLSDSKINRRSRNWGRFRAIAINNCTLFALSSRRRQGEWRDRAGERESFTASFS